VAREVNRICPDCGQLVTGRQKWASHIIKHGRVVPDPHTRITMDEDEEEVSA
jgi:hypothetical protein